MTSVDTLRSTPHLAATLAALRARLVRAVWLRGVGFALLGLTAWLGFAFVADFGLHVPRAVRVFHLAVLLGLAGFLAWRFVLRPLRRIPDEAGLAVLAERDLDGAREVLVSAVQFQAHRGDPSAVPAPAGEPLTHELEERVIHTAERRAGDVSVGRLVDLRRPLLGFAGGSVVASGLALALALHPTHASTFVDRLFGGTQPWPKRTNLVLDVRLPEGQARIDRSDPDVLRVSVARGLDVPIAVVAEGKVPDTVQLHVRSEGADRQLIPLAASAGGTFATVLRSLRQDAVLHATGGDDRDATPRIELEVLTPPDVIGLAVTVEPPAYSGLPVRTVFDGDVRALRGSRVRVVARTDPADVRGIARLLPADERLDLVAMPFPADPARGDADPGGAGLGFEWTLEQDLRYRIELLDERGLENPDPGLRALDVIEDRAPEVTLLAPGRSDVESVAGGLVPMRARVEDDFGLSGVELVVREAGDGAEAVEPMALSPTRDAPDRVGVVRASLELDEWLTRLTAGTPAEAEVPPGDVAAATEADGNEPAAAASSWMAAGRQLEIEIQARDNGTPPQVGTGPTVRVRLVSADELLRRLQDRLAKARLEATELFEQVRTERVTVDELLASLSGDGVDDAPDSRSLTSSLNGQRRVEGDADALVREVAGVCEQLLYARLDSEAEPLLVRLDASLAVLEGRAFDPAPWRDLVAYQADEARVANGLATHLLSIVELAIEAREDGARAATIALDEALDAVADPPALRDALSSARERQTATMASLEGLLERLKEWDNFQSVLALTRDILNRQKALQERTKRYASK